VLLQQRFSKMLLQGCLMLLCLSWLLLMPLIADATNADGDALKAMQATLTGSGQAFVTWDITLVTPCTWINVACDSQNNVIYLNLGNQGLSGTLAPQIGNLPFLQNLYNFENPLNHNAP
jgi:hypothetical protein